MNDRDLSPDQARALALALKPDYDDAAAFRKLKREVLDVFRPLLKPILRVFKRIIDGEA